MWNLFQALLPAAKPEQLTIINCHGQETCGIPFEQVTEVMKWLALSLMEAGYEARAHIMKLPYGELKLLPLEGILLLSLG